MCSVILQSPSKPFEESVSGITIPSTFTLNLSLKAFVLCKSASASYCLHGGNTTISASFPVG